MTKSRKKARNFRYFIKNYGLFCIFQGKLGLLIIIQALFQFRQQLQGFDGGESVGVGAF